MIFVVAVMSISLNTVTWGAVKAEATIASAVRLRTERIGTRVVRSSLVTPAKGWSRVVFMAPPSPSGACGDRSEEHTSELQSRGHIVCRLLLEKKKYFLQLGDYYLSYMIRLPPE